MEASSFVAVSDAAALDRSAEAPLYHQLYEALRESVLSGRLLPGMRLPPTRALADELDVSRNTVVSAFEQLIAEGYCEAQVGAGTFVTRDLPDELLKVRGSNRVPRASSTADASKSALSTRGKKMAGLDLSRLRDPERPRAFRPGVPALGAFPIETWSRLDARRWRSLPPQRLTYGAAAGYRPLREAIAGYLRSARGVQCTADQVVVVSGTQQAVQLAARVLLDPGDTVWMEDPGYPRARGAFATAGAEAVPVPVEAEGLDLEAGRKRAPDARMAYVTPSHQYPLGMTMSLPRRLALLDWAERAGAWVLEDDYDSEYRFEGRPLAALQGLDEAGRVIYVGTFSKVLFPALRLGYLVAPPALTEAFVSAQSMAERCPPLVSQMTVTDFIAEGHFEQHLRRMRTHYAARQAALVEAADEQLGDLLELEYRPAGLHLVGRLPAELDDHEVSRRLGERGITAPPLSFYTAGAPPRGGLVLGYGAVDEDEIRAGVDVLASTIRALL